MRLPDDVRALYSTMTAGKLEIGDEDSFFGVDVLPLATIDRFDDYSPDAQGKGMWQFATLTVPGHDTRGLVQTLPGTSPTTCIRNIGGRHSHPATPTIRLARITRLFNRAMGIRPGGPIEPYRPRLSPGRAR